jgi:hypothetical protein
MASYERLRNFAQPTALSDCVWLAIPQATNRQRIGNQIDTAFIFAGADYVNVL